MFHDEDPRTYVIPATRSLQTLQNIDNVPLTNSDAQAYLSKIEDALENTYDTVTSNANLTGDQDSPNNRYLPMYHVPDAELGRWVEYNAIYGTENTEYGDRSRVELELIISESGDKYARAIVSPTPLGNGSQVYAGQINNFTHTDAAIAATRTYGSELRAMISGGLSATEAVDFRQLDLHGLHSENWAQTRGVKYEAIRKNRENARSKLTEANWATELIEKQADQINEEDQRIINEHGDLIEDLVEHFIQKFPSELQHDRARATLYVSLVWTFPPAMMGTDNNIPDVGMFMHRLGEVSINAEVLAHKVRLLTDYDPMDVSELRHHSNNVFEAMMDIQDQLDDDATLNEIIT